MPAGLIVKISGETKDLSAALQSADGQVRAAAVKIQQALNKIDASTSSTAKSFQGIGNATKLVGAALTGLAAAAGVASLSVLTANVVKTGEQLHDLAQKTGVSVESLSRLRLAADQAGVPLDGLGQGLGKFNRSIVAAQDSTSQQARAFQALGISSAQLAAGLRDPEQLLRLVADGFARSEDSASKGAVAVALFGKSGQDLIPFLNQGSVGLKDMADLSERLGVVWTSETAAAADQLSDNLGFIKEGVVGVATTVLQQLLPQMAEASEQMLGWVTANRQWIATKITESLQSAAQSARDLAPQVRQVAGTLGGLLQAYGALPAVVQQIGIVGVLIGGTIGLAVGASLVALSEIRKFLQESAAAGNPFAKAIVGAGEASAANVELAGALGLLKKAETTATAGAAAHTEARKEGTKEILQFSAGTKAAKTAAEKLADAQIKARAEIEKELVVYRQVSAGVLTLADAQHDLEVQQLAAKLGSKALAVQYLNERDAAEAVGKVTDLIANKAQELKNIRDDEARQTAQRIKDLKTELGDQQIELKVLTESVALNRGYQETQRAIALAKIANAEATGKLTAEEANYQRQILSTTTAIDKMDDTLRDQARGFLDVGARAEDAAARIADAFLTSGGNITKAFRSLKDEAVDIFRDLFASTIRDKLNWEGILGKNLLTDIPRLFLQGGQASQSAFSSTFGGGNGGGGGGIFNFGAGLLSSGVSGQGLLPSLFGSTVTGSGGLFGGAFGSPGTIPGLGGVGPNIPGSGIFTGGNPFSFANFGGGIVGSLIGGGISGALGIGQSKPGQLGGSIGGGIGAFGGGIAGGALLGAQLGAWAGPIGAASGAILGVILGGVLGDLFKPGRIATEKKAAIKFFEEVFDGIDFKKFKEKKVAEAFDFFGTETVPSTQALGALFAKDFGKAATQGTIVRFGGQFLANLKAQGVGAEEAKQKILELAQAMGFELGPAINDINGLTTQFSKAQGGSLLSLGEFTEEVAEARKNLSKYGDTSQLTAKQLSELAIQNGNTGSKLVTLNELYAGAIDLATGFSEAVDAQGLANALLADKFAKVAANGGELTAEMIKLRDGVASGSLSIEEAAIQLNGLRESAGLAKLELQDFTLDPEQVVKAVQIIEAALQGLVNFGQGLGELLETGISSALAGNKVNFGQAFGEFFDATLRTAIVKAMVAGFLQGAAIETLRPLFEKITTLVTQLATKAITPEEFRRQFGAALTDNKELIDGLRTSFGEAGAAILKLLQGLGLIPATVGDATDATDGLAGSAQELVDKIIELNHQIEELARKRIDIQVNLLERLGSIGSLNPLQVVQGKEAVLKPELDKLLKIRSPIGTRPLLNVTDDQLNRGLDVLNQAQDLAVERYQAELQGIQDNLAASTDAIRREFEAKRQTSQQVIEGLQREKQQVQELFQSRLEGLRDELQVAQKFEQLGKSLQQQITSLVTGQGSTLSAPEQLAFLQRQSAGLRAELKTAPKSEQAGLIEELSRNLQQQLSFRTLFGAAGSDQLFNDVVRELESLRDQANREGSKAQDLQLQIASTTAQMNTALGRIDQQITGQQNLLTRLSGQEQAAVKAAQEQADFAIKDLRDRTAQTLRTLAAERDKFLQEQIKRLTEQRDLTKEQLVKQFGSAEAERLLKDPVNANTLALGIINQSLLGIKGSLDAFLGAITPAAHGFEGVVAKPRLFLAGERGPETVSIRPSGGAQASSGSGTSVQLVMPGGFTIRVEGGGDVAQQGARAGRAFIEQVIYEVRHGKLGQVIDDRARRARP